MKHLIYLLPLLLFACSETKQDTEEAITPEQELALKRDFSLGKLDYNMYLDSKEEKYKETAEKSFNSILNNGNTSVYHDSSKIYLDSLEYYELKFFDEALIDSK